MNHKLHSPGRLRRWFSRLILVGLCCALLPACAAQRTIPKAQLTGTVRAGDQVVSGGTIRLDFGDKGIATAPIDSQGSFYFGNLPVGKAAIAIDTQSAKPPKAAPKLEMPADAAQALEDYQKTIAKTPGANDKTSYVPITARYTDFQKSGLVVELRPGSNHHAVVLEKE